MESDSRAEKDGGREPEKVLIEREGKFELVNACDVQAAGGMSTVLAEHEGGRQPGEPEVVRSEATDQASPVPQSDTREQANVLAARSGHERDKSNLEATGSPLNDQHNPPEKMQAEVSALSEPSLPTVDSCSSVTARGNEGKPIGGSQDSTAGVIPSGEQAVGLASSCQVHIVTPERVPKGAASPKTAKDLSSASAASLRPRDRAKWKRNTSRVQSAPGGRPAGKSKREPEDAEKKREKQQMNEAAFAAWVSRKDEELLERQKQERTKNQTSEEVLKQKRQRNGAAFQAWVASKERELHGQRERKKDSNPSTRTSHYSEEMSSAAFERWMSHKREQKQREAGLEGRRKQEEEEAAKKADPTIVDQAYKK